MNDSPHSTFGRVDVDGDFVAHDKIVQPAPVGVPALHQLPPPPADFTGRHDQLAALRRVPRLPGPAILALRGLGGVGKTALALKLAYGLADDYPEGQLFVNLQGVTQPLTPEAVMAHVIRAFKPVEKLPDDPAELAAIYRSLLADQRVLLFFDNAASAEQLRPLLPPAGCLVITTSRSRFALPGMTAITLDSLPPAEAQARLLRLAPRIGAQAARLAGLCAGLPLALGLVGGALAEREDLEPADYAERLAHARLGELDEVAASLRLSYDLLPAASRALWPLLAAFPADFEKTAAATVWALEPGAAADGLSDLLRYSLLEFNPASKRYRLHDLARDFARALLSSAELAAAQARHAHYFARVLFDANQLYLQGGDHIRPALAAYDAERANFVAGQAWAVAASASDELAARLVSSYASNGTLLLLRQPLDERITWLTAAVAAAQRLEDADSLGRHLSNLGMAYIQADELPQAIDTMNQALALQRGLPDPRGVADVLGNLGIVYTRQGDYEHAAVVLGEQLASARALRDRRRAASAVGNLGIVRKYQGRPERASALYRRQLILAHAAGNQMSEADACWNWGRLLEEQGQLAEAARLIQCSVDLERKLGLPQAEEKAAWLEALRQRLAAPGGPSTVSG